MASELDNSGVPECTIVWKLLKKVLFYDGMLLPSFLCNNNDLQVISWKYAI